MFVTLLTLSRHVKSYWHYQDQYTIKPGTPEHGTTEHGTPAERRNNAGTTEQDRNNGTPPEQSKHRGTAERYERALAE